MKYHVDQLIIIIPKRMTAIKAVAVATCLRIWFCMGETMWKSRKGSHHTQIMHKLDHMCVWFEQLIVLTLTYLYLYEMCAPTSHTHILC